MLTHEQICGAVEKLAHQYSLTKASYFGSYANGRATEESDLDLLVEFAEPDVCVLEIVGLKQDLEEMLRTPVDVIHAPIPARSHILVGKTVVVYEN